MEYDVETLAYLESESEVAAANWRIDFFAHDSATSIADADYWIDANRGIIDTANRWAGDDPFSNGLRSRSLAFQAWLDSHGF